MNLINNMSIFHLSCHTIYLIDITKLKLDILKWNCSKM